MRAYRPALVLLALLTCAVGAPIAFLAGAYRSQKGLEWSRKLALAFGLWMLLATLAMEYALVTHDFSVSYVASVGSLATPLHITIVSLWSSLEGSILFWGLVLGIFTAAGVLFAFALTFSVIPALLSRSASFLPSARVDR